MHNDILYILNRLREEDKSELIELFGNKWKRKTLKRLKNTDVIILKNSNSLPFAMGGIEGINSVACVWLLTTDEVYNNKYRLAKVIKKELLSASEKFEIFYNFIYKSNFSAKIWLKKAGFKFDNPKPRGIDIPKNFEFFYMLTKKERT